MFGEEGPKEYIKLTDNILEKVEDVYDEIKSNPASLNLEFKDNFKTAVDIIERIRRRNTYKFVKEFNYFIQEGANPKVV